MMLQPAGANARRYDLGDAIAFGMLGLIDQEVGAVITALGSR